VKGKCPRGRMRSRWKQDKKHVTKKEEKPWEEMRSSCGKTERDGSLVVRQYT
jgi:hypothetical protein